MVEWGSEKFSLETFDFNAIIQDPNASRLSLNRLNKANDFSISCLVTFVPPYFILLVILVKKSGLTDAIIMEIISFDI